MKTKVILTTVIGILFLNLSTNAQVKIDSYGNVGINGAAGSRYCPLKVHGRAEMSTLKIGTSSAPPALLSVGPAPSRPFRSYSVYCYGAVYATRYYSASDKRLKKDIENINNPMNRLMKITGKSYAFKNNRELNSVNWKKGVQHGTNTSDTVPGNGFSNFKQDRQFGVLAQEVETIFPELVNYDSTSDSYSVDYNGFIPIIIEALKDQQAEIIELKNKSKKKAKLKNAGAANSEMLTNASLSPARPNPFNTETSIEYYLPANVSKATLYIYNLQGKQIKSINIVQREHGSETIYASELTPGMYKYALIADGSIVGTETMILTE